jgi:hypothetical protein
MRRLLVEMMGVKPWSVYRVLAEMGIKPLPRVKITKPMSFWLPPDPPFRHD